LSQECGESISAQKDILQDAQSQISNVIEPTAERLLPIVSELQDVYHQIDLLEVCTDGYGTLSAREGVESGVEWLMSKQVLISRVSENIKQMASRVERTELALRREERALNDGKPTAMWKEQEKVRVFSAREYVENGRLLDRP